MLDTVQLGEISGKISGTQNPACGKITNSASGTAPGKLISGPFDLQFILHFIAFESKKKSALI